VNSVVEIARRFLAARAGEKGAKGDKSDPAVAVGGFDPFPPFSPGRETDQGDVSGRSWVDVVLLAVCPECGRALDRERCWHCHWRLCEVCRERNTGSAFIACCLLCDLGRNRQ
jgi:hypothetical protein